MIENDKQYQVTQDAAAMFEKTLAYFHEIGNASGLHPLLYKAQEDALQSQLDELNAELHEYEERINVKSND